MGNSADRAWQLSQLVEGVSTACNPSHVSLSCVKTNCVSFASVQARKLNHSVSFSFPHEVGYFVGTPFMAGHLCPNKLGGMMQPARAAHGAFLARQKLTASGSSRVPCAFPNLWCCPRCWLFSCLGLWSHPHISPKEHQRSAAAIYSVAALLHYFFHGALRNILLSAGFPVTIS